MTELPHHQCSSQQMMTQVVLRSPSPAPSQYCLTHPCSFLHLTISKSLCQMFNVITQLFTLQVSFDSSCYCDLSLLWHLHHDNHHPELHCSGRRRSSRREKWQKYCPHLLWLHVHLYLCCWNGSQASGSWSCSASWELLPRFLEHPWCYCCLLCSCGFYVCVSLPSFRSLIPHKIKLLFQWKFNRPES